MHLHQNGTQKATCAPASKVEEELKGTHLAEVVVPTFHRKLDAAFDLVITPIAKLLEASAGAGAGPCAGNAGGVGNANSPQNNDGWASKRMVQWAAAVYWSRAVLVPLNGQRCEALTPLVDLMNHRPGK